MIAVRGWRRWAGTLLSLIVVVVLLLGTVRVALRVPAVDVLNPHQKAGSVDYSADSVSGLAPLNSAYIKEILGARPAEEFGAAPEKKISSPRGPVVQGRRIVQTPSGSNDTAARAQNIDRIPFTGRTNTGNSTIDPGETQPCQPTTATVWYRYAPAKDVGLSASTIGSDFSTVLAVYNANNLQNALTCKDASTYGSAYKVAFKALAGRAYLFQVGGITTAKGNLVFNLDPAPGPPNDNFASATVIRKLPVKDRTNTASASTELLESQGCSSSLHATVWYRYTPAVSTPLLATTTGSDFSTVLGVFEGRSSNSLSELTCDSAQGTLYPSRIAFTPVAGHTYNFVVGGINNNERGDLVFTLTTTASRPANDDFARARFAGISSTDRPLIFGATLEPGERQPSCATDIVGSVWYRYTSAATTQLTADTIESRAGINTVIAVFTGSSLGDAQEVPLACNDDAVATSGSNGFGTTAASRTTFIAQAGTTYFFQVGIKAGDQYNLAFRLSRTE